MEAIALNQAIQSNNEMANSWTMNDSDYRDYKNEKSISGKVSRIHYSNESFTVGTLNADSGPDMDRACKFVIKDSVKLNEHITLRGIWEKGKYGMQFTAASVEYAAPNIDSIQGLADYIKNMDGSDGIGPIKARKIAEAFAGEDFDKIIREQPERVAEAAKLKIDKILSLQQTWTEQADVNAISVWLISFGITANQVRKIARTFGNKAREILNNNPYELHHRIEGIGFLRNDEIALKMGLPKNSSYRLRSGLMYLVNQMSEDSGHTYIMQAELIGTAIKTLYLDDLDAGDLIRREIAYLSDPANGPKLITLELNSVNYVGSAWLHHQEQVVTDRLVNVANSRIQPIDYSDIIESKSVDLDSLTDEQRDAVSAALNNPVSIITGGAGTGKSHTIRLIKDVLSGKEKSVEVAAPTGKAARRLQNDGIYAQTIHRLLEFSPVTNNFTRNEENPINADCIIIDEVSMCAIPLLYSLIQAIDMRRTRIVLVGDYNQLPPIGPGNTLRDLVDNQLVPVTKLNKCHRNAGQLKVNCGAILNGSVNTIESRIDKSIKTDDQLLQKLSDKTPAWSVIKDRDDSESLIDLLRILQREQFAKWGFDPLFDCQIIVPQNPGALGVNRINLELQRVEQAKRGIDLPAITNPNARGKLMIGDKVMQIKNDYNIPNGLMNGTQGVILDIVNKENPKNPLEMISYYSIQFDDRDNPIELQKDADPSANLVLAYAVTCHKVQGSQYPCVVSVIHRMHSYMLSRNLLYTAVTRARYTSIILGESHGIQRAARMITNMDRRTWTGLDAKMKKEQIVNNDSAHRDVTAECGECEGERL